MTKAPINEEALNQVLQKLSSFVWTEKDKEERDNMRQQFRETYDKDRINALTKEDYFAGLGRKKGCLAYDLEWGTRSLGSISGRLSAIEYCLHIFLNILNTPIPQNSLSPLPSSPANNQPPFCPRLQDQFAKNRE